MAIKDRLAGLPVIGTAIRVQDRYKADAGDQFAAAIGFFGFLSLFPLLILALAVAGFVLAGRPPGDAAAVADAITDAIPGFTATLSGDCPAGDTGCQTAVARALGTIIENRGGIGLIGLVSLLFTGLRVTNSAQTAALKVFGVDLLTLKGWKLRVRQLVALVGLGALALVGAAASSVVGYVASLDPTGAVAVLAPVGGVAVTLLADFALFLAAYRLFLGSDAPEWRRLVPGALLAGLGWTALKVFGSTYVSGQVANASELYGALGGVIGLLLLFYLAGRLYVYGAELSAERLDRAGGKATEVPGETAEEAAGEHENFDQTPDDEMAPDENRHDHKTQETTMSETPDAERRVRRERVDAAIQSRLSASPTASAIAAEAEKAVETPAMRAARAGRPTAFSSGDPSTAISDGTRRRLQQAEGPASGGPRHAAAFALAVAAVGGLVAVFKPWERD